MSNKLRFKADDDVIVTSNELGREGERGTVIEVMTDSTGRPMPYPYRVKFADGECCLVLDSECSSVTKLAPQTRAILDHLKRVGTISGVEAQALYRARSLTKRISELRRAGYPIVAEWKRDHTQQRYRRYHYAG